MLRNGSTLPDKTRIQTFVANAANPVDLQVGPAATSSTPTSTAERSSASATPRATRPHRRRHRLTVRRPRAPHSPLRRHAVHRPRPRRHAVLRLGPRRRMAPTTTRRPLSLRGPTRSPARTPPS
jgi:hypothetical protein